MEPRNRFQGIDSASLCPGRPVQQPYSNLVPSPLRLLYSSSTVLVFLNNLWVLGTESESIPGLLKRLQIRAQATLASGIGSLESIPGLFKRLQIRVHATLASGIGSLELIPGLLKCLQIRAQATLASGIGSLESIWAPYTFKNMGSGYIG